MFRQSIELDAKPEVAFDLSQDYERRLDWDPFLVEARLLFGAERAGLGVVARCVARTGYAMETRYVSFNPPGACAVEMTSGPWFFRSFAGSWRFEPIPENRSRVTFAYTLVARPVVLSGLLRFIFARATRRRLDALKRALQAPRDRQGIGLGFRAIGGSRS